MSVEEAIACLESAKREHYADYGHDGCAKMWNRSAACNCGADEINARLDSVIEWLRKKVIPRVSISMIEIDDGLWIGDWHDAREADCRMLDERFHIVTVASDSPFRGHERFPLVDGPGNDAETFLAAVRYVHEARKKHPRVLVHCIAGQSRSAAVVVGALMLSGRNWCEAYDLLIKKHERARIHPAFSELIRMVESERVPA